jgi:glycosyltransferase involved in cell wall biosynthesis
MRIVLDLQKAQIESALETVNKPTLLLAQAIVRNREDHDIILALSGLFPDTLESVRAAFDHLLPQKNIRVWHSAAPVRESGLGNKWRRQVAEHIREAFLAHLQPDIVFIPSFFDGYEDECVTSIGVFAPHLKTVVAVHGKDTAPIDNTGSDREIHRLHRLEQLKLADLLWVTLSLAADPVLQQLKLPPERIKTAEIGGHDASAQAIGLIKAFEELVSAPSESIGLPPRPRPKLAYVSPLPPERSGIADHSAELLPELARFYDIDVIVSQSDISTPWVIANCGVRSADWLRQNAHLYDRVLYHFGNSGYHRHMFDLLPHVPGTIVLHDFYLGDIHHYLETHAVSPYAHTRALYKSHGYAALAERFRADRIVDVVGKYPVNLEVIQLARAVIVHSQYSRCLANEWYGRQFSNDWKVIPLLRQPNAEADREQARKIVGLKPGDFMICSFGLLGATKLNHRLLEAWINSRLASDANCALVFVGEEQSGEYGAQLRRTIQSSGLGKRIKITDWVDMAAFRNYLAAADIAVQLRAQSRGETSAAVLDCMNYALPTIVNAHGSFAELPSDAVWMLPDAFEDNQLIEAMETLRQDAQRRSTLGIRAKEVVLNRHAPNVCAEHYAHAIEQGYAAAQSGTDGLITAIARLEGYCPTDIECLTLAQSISEAIPIATAAQQLLIDVSATCRNDLKTGIQRVVRALVWELVQAPPLGYRVEPVYLSHEGGVWHYRYARHWTSGTLGVPGAWMADEPVDCLAGDRMLIADFTAAFAIEAERAGIYKELKNNGVELHFFVYDLLPVLMPEYFPPGQFGFSEWLDALTGVADGAMCISNAVAKDLESWLKTTGRQHPRPMRIDWFHLGADIENSIPSTGLPQNAEHVLSKINATHSFLMVGTIEPRKGYLQTLQAFTRLWQQGHDINLVIVGKEGWNGLPDDLRRSIPETVRQLRSHPELGQRLLWLEGISDEYLEKIYAASTCLIAASEGEGFGLPLIEAAQHKLPIIARDMPIFREVAGKHAYYFAGLEPRQLMDAIINWLDLKKADKAPISHTMQWLTWKESAANLVKKLGIAQSS